MDRRIAFLLVIVLLVVVGGTFVVIGLLRGDNSTDPNGVNSAPVVTGVDDHLSDVRP